MPRSSSLRRLSPLVVAVAMLAAACGSTTASVTPSPAPSASATTAPTTAPTATAAAPTNAATAGPTAAPTQAPASDPVGTACAPQDLLVASAGWEAAAGSRLAEVRVANQGPAPCSLEPPAVAILDPGGNALLTSEPEAAAAGPADVAPGAAATFTIQFGNWCRQTVAFPLQPVLVAGSGAGVRIDGLELTSADDTPPCNGPGQEPVLTTSGWAE